MGELVDPLASVRAYLAAEKSSNTRRAYASDFADFVEWCRLGGHAPLPAVPIAVAQYLAQLADRGLRASTIERRVAAIRYAHKAAGHEPPTNAEGVKAVMRGIRRARRTKPRRVKPATAELLTKVLEHLSKPADRLSDRLRALRDRALLLVGFAAARRRSELVALHVCDITVHQKGIVLQIRRSKTDQGGQGAEIPIPRGGKLQAVEALEAWLAAAAISTGPLFREIDRHGNVGTKALSDRSVARIVKRALKPLGVNVDDFAGHSLRAGFITTALAHKVDKFLIMGISGHVKVDTLKIYDRREIGLEDHPGEGFL